MAPDAPPDTPPDAPVIADAGACESAAGFYVASSTCPGLDDVAFGACIAQTACAATIALEVGTGTAAFALEDDLGLFTDGELGPDVDCTEARVTSTGLDVFCTDRIGAGCMISMTRRDTTLDGLCCIDDAPCGDEQACTLVSVAAGPPVTTACVAREGAVGRGGACTRSTPGDDCEPGLHCSGFGGSADAPTCHALCREPADCMAGEACIASGSAPAMGLCSDACDPFTAGTCGTGRGCAPSDVYAGVGDAVLGAACGTAGTGALGDECATDGCIDGLFCVRDESLALRCSTPCDEAHPCADGECTALGTGDLGACR